ncbi:MAG: hypothetical protein OXF61_16520, partial [Acidimicrobiaceae bacterium]|nr:hypothetical protein [Acidimicrobiaceae bacterium]
LLLVRPNPRFTLVTLAKHSYGHDLEKLYAELEADDRDHVDHHVQEHRSLHDYHPPGLDIATAEQFIAHINTGGPQGGLVSWRYILIEGVSQVPSTSLWGMSEIWDAICCRIRKDVFDKPDDCFRLSRRLTSQFDRLVTGRPVPYDRFIDDLRGWAAHKDDSLLAAWIDLLGKAHRDVMHEVQAPDRLQPELADMAHRALAQMANEPADPDNEQLLNRIQAEPGLAWDPSDGAFR